MRHTRWTALLLALACAGSGVRAAHAATAWASRLDSRLVAALAPGAGPVSVWVEFTDKGEAGPGDLAARLTDAERALTPEARARRLRAHVTPLVDYRDLPLAPAYLAALRAQGLAPYGASRWFNGCAVRTSGAALANLAALECVRRVSPVPLAAPRRREPDLGERLQFPPPPAGALRARHTEAAYGRTGSQLARLGLPPVHDYGFNGTNVLIAVFDEGFNYYDKHTATRNIDVGNRTRDFIRGGTSVQDTAGVWYYFQHGLWTLSVIGGNAPGIYLGPAFGARFALARTEDSSSEKPIEMVNWLMAAEWADSLGADVISSSLGYFYFPDSAGTSLTKDMLDGHTTIITRATEIAASKGILVVNSAGNSGAQGIDVPADACGDSMLAVGAVDSLGNYATFSSVGPTYDGRIKPDLTAQGVAVLMAEAVSDPNTYARKNGTSFSCPLVAGVAACLIGAHPDHTPVEIIAALKATSSKALNPDNLRGWGIPNAYAALNWIADTANVPGPPGALQLALLGPNPALAGGAPVLVQIARASNSATGAPARVALFDTQGRRVRTLWSGVLAPGGFALATWDGTDSGGRAARSGLYFVALESGSDRVVRRLTFVR